MTTDPRQSFSVDGMVVLITGGGRGLGRAMALGLGRAGAKIAVCGRTVADVSSTVAQIESDGGSAIGMAADISDMDTLPGIVERTVDRFDRLDGVVNNAVSASFGAMLDIAPEDFDAATATNVKAPLYLSNAAVPHLMQSDRASIVNVLSVYVDIGGPGTALYRATKSALAALTKAMANEWAALGIRVNGISPGPFEMARPREPDHEQLVRELTAQQRIAAFDEIVPPILFLLSDAARFMTGATLVFDGGMSLGTARRAPSTAGARPEGDTEPVA